MKRLFTQEINDISQIAEARRMTSYAVSSMGFNEQDIGKISIIVTELTNNLLKHTLNGGEYHLYKISDQDTEGIEMITLDKGPGMRSVSECIRDGFSTAGSPGTGLGSINRLSDFFDIYSSIDSGTVVLSRLWLKKKKIRGSFNPFEVSAIIVPKKNEEACGDKWMCIQENNKTLVIAVDGLGHGTGASIAASEAVAGFEANKNFPITDIMQSLSLRMAHTRGAAVAIAEINLSLCTLQYCGIGNIAAAIINKEGSKSLISLNGIVGQEIRKIQSFNYPWTNDSLLIMSSDGLSTRWNLDKYPGLFFKSLTIICAVLYRDFSRGNDDLLVIALRQRCQQ